MRNHTVRRPLAAAGALAATLTLAACGSSGGSTGAPAPSGSTSPAAADGRTNRGPAASGTIAAITGRTMQVQNQQSGQVAVQWTGATAFSHEVVVSAAKIEVGSCVVATAAEGSATSSFTATRVVVSSPANGTCGGAFPGGNRPAGAPTGQRPSGLPTDFPSGARPSGLPGRNRTGAVAAGTVTARSGNTFTVTMPSFGPSTSSTSSTKRTVLLAAATKVYEQARTTAKSLAVGRCVTAEGKADSSGTVTATRVQISQPTAGSCTTGLFGRVGNGG